jgi:hypothetical protein
MEYVQLTKAIYVKPLVSSASTIEETKVFEQEQRSRELEEELERALNFLRRTITSTSKPTAQVIIISDLEEEVEIRLQLVVEEQF